MAQINNNPVGFVVCRVGAVLVATSAFNGLGFMIEPLLGGSADLRFFLMFVLMTLVPLVAAFLLWAYSDQISHIPFAPQRPTTIGDFSAEELLSIGIHLIGIYILVFGVISMAGTESLALAQSSWFSDNESIRQSVSAHTIGNRISYAVQIGLGYFLLMRGKRG